MPYSIDPNGRWSERQVHHVLETLRPEAAEHGLTLEPVEVTTHGEEGRWYIIVARCARHKLVVPVNYACEACLKEWQGAGVANVTRSPRGDVVH